MRLTDLYVVCRAIGIKDEIKAKFKSNPKPKEEEKKEEVKKEEVAAVAMPTAVLVGPPAPATEVAVVEVK
jgi:hypothetical protein